MAIVQVKEQIELTETEKKIFDRLLKTLRHFNLQTQLRVAGGWVRDKLLGKESHDIDIALDNMLGSEFILKVKEYLSFTGEKAQGLFVIPSNPVRSKHLETATMHLFDISIDFVNLSCEDYSENSRIPAMKFGTAKEDAYRRDLTINSLFYNINSNCVEDFTNRGIEDLKFGRIVTPLPPMLTLLGDPLRALRGIRFAARFDFTLDEELKEAAASDKVKEALGDKNKISRERIGTEIDLMFSGNQPVKAIDYICDLELFGAVFKVEPAVPEDCYRLCAAYVDATWKFIQLIKCSSFDDEKRRLCLYSALFLPLRDKDPKARGNPGKHIIKNSLKRKVSDADTVKKIHESLEKFLSLIPSLLSNDDNHLNELDWAREVVDVPVAPLLPVLTGFVLTELKDYWRVALLLSTLLYPTDTDCTQDIINRSLQLDQRKDLFVSVDNAIVKLGLDKVWNLKPLVTAKDIMNFLQLKVGGPIVSKWQRRAMAWQLAHPSGTSEECLDWMRETHSKLMF